MRLSILSLVCLSAAFAAPHVFADELPTPAGLGQMESLMDSCSKSDPKSASDIKKQHEKMVQGFSERDLAKVRGADEYQTTYQEFHDRFEKVSKDEMMKACKVLLGPTSTSGQGKK